MDDTLRVAADARIASCSQGGATPVNTATLEDACLGLHRACPARSAKRRFHFVQLACFVAVVALAGWALREHTGATLATLHVAAITLFATAMLWRLVAASNLAPVLSRIAAPVHWPTYTILCPLYLEANITADLVAALERLDYPRSALDIKLIVEEDDHETLEAALAVARAPHVEVVVVPASAPRTKPKALNVGLARARGAYVAVYDAEDRPHPLQLRAALAAFEDGGKDLACVQATLAIDNAEASWISRQFAAEYAIHFLEILPLLTRLGLPLPLGGSSNHFRTEVLRAAGGWDPYNVKEDNAQNAMISRRKFQRDFTHPIRVPLKA